MAFWQEFRAFIAKGNAIDLAVGVIIGTAFGKITNSLVNDILTPPLGLVIGKTQFSKLAWTLLPEHKLADGTVQPGVVIGYGQLIQNVLDFLLIAFCVFMLIKGINLLRMQPEPKDTNTPPPPPPEDIRLLGEIRDLLAKQSVEKSPETASAPK